MKIDSIPRLNIPIQRAGRAQSALPIFPDRLPGTTPAMPFLKPLISFAGAKTYLGSVIEQLSPAERNAVQSYGAEYKRFLRTSVCSSWTAKNIIDAAKGQGFKAFPKDGQAVKPGDKFYINNDFESVALVVIGMENPVKTGFNIVGSHLDSPQLELKPDTVTESKGVLQLKTKYRGGGTWMTWFNRPLGIAGRVFQPVLGTDGRPKLDPITHLPMQKVTFVRVDSPPVVIPVEAIHVNREINEGRKINKETDLNPVAGISRITNNRLYDTISENVIETLKTRGIDLNNASRAELFLYPASPAVDVGIDKSMILAQGHDDRSMCFAAMKAMFETATGKLPAKTSIAYFFDNEETGSLDRGGATSRWTESIAGQILRASQMEKVKDLGHAREAALSKSIIFSADVAHGVIPPHAKYFDPQNAGYLGYGPVIKVDSTGHYATTARGAAIVQDMCARSDIPYQVVSTRQDVTCGTTIGPMIAAQTNALTVDMGAPIVSMHSAQELGATVDFYLTKKLFKTLFQNC